MGGGGSQVYSSYISYSLAQVYGVVQRFSNILRNYINKQFSDPMHACIKGEKDPLVKTPEATSSSEHGSPWQPRPERNSWNSLLVKVLGRNLSYLKLRFSTFVLPFYKNDIYEHSNFCMDLKTKVVEWFSVRFSTFFNKKFYMVT